jgi:transcriptional regulator with XRE-family HTH domain
MTRSECSPIGDQLRTWRERRGLSQLDLALDADVSARHLSFIETGRAQPGRDLLLRLLEELEAPLRERNTLLTAAGFAPIFQHRPFTDKSFDGVRGILKAALHAHSPFPAYVIDRYWNVVASNAAVPELYEGVSEHLMRPPLNVIRMILHPEGFGERLVNRSAWRGHLIAQLRRQANLTRDPLLNDLLHEALSYPKSDPNGSHEPLAEGVALPMIVDTQIGRLSFIGATTVFGGAADVTLEEIALEMLYPADASTEAAIRRSALAKMAESDA